MAMWAIRGSWPLRRHLLHVWLPLETTVGLAVDIKMRAEAENTGAERGCVVSGG